MTLKELEDLSDQECTCTPDQQSGKDWTTCPSCQASYFLNDIHEQVTSFSIEVKK